ncbi:MAG TPA: penicillin acylase family protein [Flavisolibacter sp.]|nr:penicillin acylase family protein [Flavisolibacter sp.]
MKKYIVLFLLLPLQLVAQPFTKAETSRWEAQAKKVTIIRDNWGIPHIYGGSDADAVFGLLYAQCEDDFKRVELNYIEKLGRLSEVRGAGELYNDLLIKLLIDSSEAVADYNKAEPWLKKLLNAYADGINYYLYKNPQVKPALLQRFKPWYQLLWTDGSIGAINTADITTTELKNFYSGEPPSYSFAPKDPDHQTGSNGFAIAPSRTASGNAILYINPHVTFYFRPEVQVVSAEGLNAYGAVTWGQFFVYQGFNEHCGWMHTSANVDVADVYEETIIKKGGDYFYQYEKELRPVRVKNISIAYREGSQTKTKNISAFYTHHGPVMAQRGGKWISLRSYNRSLTSLQQSWLRTKAKGFEEYKKVMDLRANTSNSTVFADSKGYIALWHGNYIPVRDKALNWSRVVDGSKASTEWKGLHKVDETVHIYNPPNGWIQNTNSTPFTGAGVHSPKRENYPLYMAPDGENFRALNAQRVLSRDSSFTIDKVIAAGYDRYLSAFHILVPAVVAAYERLAATDTLHAQLKEPIRLLRNWDLYSSDTSVATTLAIEWAQKLGPAIQRVYVDEGESDQVQKTTQFAATATPQQLLLPLSEVLTELSSKWGKWQMPWGAINRFQRLTGDIQSTYDDAQPSFPVPFASATWGQLPSYNSRYYPGTAKRYGVSGNSFICAVEFGKRIKAKSLLAGGQSGNPRSKHFNDQALMYTKGQFKDVLFYKEDVLKHVERQYHPGQ